ncbi:hypothetical protein PtrSN001C_010116 [Pyrenophora tritici-repentis]|nr:hypothetical protein PtrSN001C_010116 [Pyrenophora tritici-repentis]
MVSCYALVAIIATIVSTSAAQSLTDDDYYTPTSRRTASTSTSAFWTYTARFVDQVTESAYTYYDGSVTIDTWTTVGTIKDGVTPTLTPYSMYTSSEAYYRNLQIVEAYYTTNAVAATDIVPATTDESDATATASTTLETSTSIFFSMPVTMTAPSSCPTIFTITTTASVDVPSKVTAQVTPTSVEKSTSHITYGQTVYMYETWYLSANAAPFTSSTDPDYSDYITSCSTPHAPYRTGSSRSGSSSSDYDDCYSFFYCHTSLRTTIIVIATVLPLLFLLGFLESFFWFRRLMCGKSAMRCGTICWIALSLLVLCFTRMQDRRSEQDQKLLKEKWVAMGKGAKLRAWWRWGFRFRYPEELLGQFCKTTVGIVEPGQPLHPAMAQTAGNGAGVAVPGQVYYYGPPQPNGGWVSQQQAGYYGGVSKDVGVVSQYPVSNPQQQQMSNISPISPQTPQPIHPHQNTAPTQPTPPPHPAQPQPTAQNAPQIPPIRINASPVVDISRETPPSSSVVPPPPNTDPKDRDLYE